MMRLLAILTAVFCSSLLFAQDGPIKVEMVQNNGNWVMLRGGEPYYINGAGGSDHLDKIVECGGNSLRTWGVDNAQFVLDEAHKRGLTVMLGFWMGHERHGFSYSDEWAVQDQFIKFKEAVIKYKDHPALLMWGVGNEMDLFYSDFNVWDAVEDIAAMIAEEDPNHPSCVVTAGIDVAEVQMIKERAPSIDILGVNTYGDLPQLPKKIDLFGWEGPYCVTEWGPNGHWEVPKTSWGAPYEQSGPEKCVSYRERFFDHIKSDVSQCIGSYVFHWGQKQETTPTWYGVFLEDGTATSILDVIYEAWNGKLPPNRSPELVNWTINGSTFRESLKVSNGEKCEVVLEAKDPEGDPLEIKYEFLPESIYTKSGGDVEVRPGSLNGLIIKQDEKSMMFKAPKQQGAYRLFIYIYDDHGHVTTANFPFYAS